MKNKIWVFGDSFSHFFKCTRPDYYELKGGNVKNYGQILSDKLGFELKLYASGGFSNESIFFSIVDRIESIENNDIVIINWTDANRFRLLNNDNQFIEFNSHHIDEYSEKIVKLESVSKKTLQEIMYHRSIRNYAVVVCDYIKIINKLLIKNQVIHWSWVDFNGEVPLTIEYMDLETIKDETDGLINDLHYGETAHIILSDVFYKLIKK
jgi:hypothetical protein